MPRWSFLDVFVAALLSAAPDLGLTAAAAQTPGRAVLTGIVFDSLAGRPLAAGTVQLAPAADSLRHQTFAATTDSVGRYEIRGLAPGVYLAGFFHPVLDSLGFTSAHQRLVVRAGAMRADFAVPSAATLLAAVCPGRAADDSTGLLLGHVRETQSAAPLAGATVAASWTELVAGPVLVKPQEQARAAETTEQGWFALCGVPGETAVLLRAAKDADSSGYIRLTVPVRGVRHVPFYVGGAERRTLVEGDTAAAAPNATVTAAQQVWRGTQRLRGGVRDARGTPVAGAEVVVWGTGLGARTNTRGEFGLDSLPGGTQMMEVRAVGFTPVQQVVQLTGEQGRSVSVRLGERAVALPEVNVRAQPSSQLRLTHFYQRMRDAEKGINHGYFITPEDIERRRSPFVSYLVEGIPGIRVVRDPTDHVRSARIKGPLRVGHLDWCDMTIYVDGARFWPRLHSKTAFDSEDSVDLVIGAATINAIEVYPRPTGAPPQYQSLNGTCGVILIWTK